MLIADVQSICHAHRPAVDPSRRRPYTIQIGLFDLVQVVVIRWVTRKRDEIGRRIARPRAADRPLRAAPVKYPDRGVDETDGFRLLEERHPWATEVAALDLQYG